MKIQIIWGYLPYYSLEKLNVMEDRPGFLDQWGGNYEAAILTQESLQKEHESEYFRTYNPLYINYLDDAVALESVFIWDGKKLKRFKEFPELCAKIECMGPGEALCDTDFSKEWKQ